MSRPIVYLVAVLLVTGCTGLHERLAAREEAQLAAFAEKCEKIGFKKDSAENKDCVVKLVAGEQSRPSAGYVPRTQVCNSYNGQSVCRTY